MEEFKKASAPVVPGGYLGAVDDGRQGRVSGWAITREGDACEVIALVNGRSFSTKSSLPRPDLATKGQSRGQGGWRIEIGEALQPGENRVDVHLPDGTPLAGSPRTVTGEAAPAATRYLGAIDTANAALLSGWALTASGDPCTLTVQIGDAASVLLVSDGTRADLAKKGMSAGAGGWHLFLDGHLAPGSNLITVTLPDGTPLPGSPLRIERPAANAAPTPTTEPKKGKVAEFPERPRATMPSLVELDELSLDDIALAVASGRVRVEAPPAPPPVPPVALVAPEPEVAPAPSRLAWFARLLKR